MDFACTKEKSALRERSNRLWLAGEIMWATSGKGYNRLFVFTCGRHCSVKKYRRERMLKTGLPSHQKEGKRRTVRSVLRLGSERVKCCPLRVYFYAGRERKDAGRIGGPLPSRRGWRNLIGLGGQVGSRGVWGVAVIASLHREEKGPYTSSSTSLSWRPRVETWYRLLVRFRLPFTAGKKNAGVLGA